MNTRQIIVIFCLFAVFFSALSIASASDVVDNMTVSVANDENTIDTANSNNEILTDPPNGTFADLEGDIEAVPGSGNLPLEKNYTYNGVGQTINISKSMTIDGQGHTISGIIGTQGFFQYLQGGKVKNKVLSTRKRVLKNFLNFFQKKG